VQVELAAAALRQAEQARGEQGPHGAQLRLPAMLVGAPHALGPLALPLQLPPLPPLPAMPVLPALPPPGALFDAFQREASLMMAALRAQGEALQQQAAVAAAAGRPLPRRLCPHRAAAAAALAAAAEARATAKRSPLPPGARRVSVAVGPGFRMVAVHTLSDGAAAAAAAAAAARAAGAAPAERPQQLLRARPAALRETAAADEAGALRQPGPAGHAMLAAIAAACAAAFAAVLRALVQLRAALLAEGGDDAYLRLHSDDEGDASGAGEEPRARRPGRGSDAELERPLLLSAADAAGARPLDGARVAVVLPGNAPAWERASFRNQAFAGGRQA
jgi:hypothetical protein